MTLRSLVPETSVSAIPPLRHEGSRRIILNSRYRRQATMCAALKDRRGFDPGDSPALTCGQIAKVPAEHNALTHQPRGRQ